MFLDILYKCCQLQMFLHWPTIEWPVLNACVCWVLCCVGKPRTLHLKTSITSWATPPKVLLCSPVFFPGTSYVVQASLELMILCPALKADITGAHQPCLAAAHMLAPSKLGADCPRLVKRPAWCNPSSWGEECTGSHGCEEGLSRWPGFYRVLTP